jgi:hypothetical protein
MNERFTFYLELVSLQSRWLHCADSCTTPVHIATGDASSFAVTSRINELNCLVKAR